MDREPEDVRHHRTIELGGTVTAGFYDRVDEQGRPHVAVLLEQRLIPGGEVGHEFRTDMTRLDAVRAAAYEYSQGGIREQGERTEQVLDCTITCFPFADAKTVEDFAVEIEQTTSRGDQQVCLLDYKRLATVVSEGRKVEEELGLQTYHTLVYKNSLERAEDGRVYAQAFQSFATEEGAEEHLWNSGGVALYRMPQRFDLKDGDRVELYAGAELLTDRGKRLITVEERVGEIEWDKQRESEHFVLAKWNDVSRPPRLGEQVFSEGDREATNGVPQDYRARPSGVEEQGEPAEPMYVVIRKSEGRPRVGTVEWFSGDRNELAGKLAEFERQEQHRDRVNRMVTTEWSDQTLGMEGKRRDFEPKL